MGCRYLSRNHGVYAPHTPGEGGARRAVVGPRRGGPVPARCTCAHGERRRLRLRVQRGVPRSDHRQRVPLRGVRGRQVQGGCGRGCVSLVRERHVYGVFRADGVPALPAKLRLARCRQHERARLPVQGGLHRRVQRLHAVSQGHVQGRHRKRRLPELCGREVLCRQRRVCVRGVPGCLDVARTQLRREPVRLQRRLCGGGVRRLPGGHRHQRQRRPAKLRGVRAGKICGTGIRLMRDLPSRDHHLGRQNVCRLLRLRAGVHQGIMRRMSMNIHVRVYVIANHM